MNASPRNETPPALLRREDQGGVATLTLQAPASRNALSLAMIEALMSEFAALGADPSVRVVVLAGDGPALSAGHDLKELRAHRNDADRGQAFYERVMKLCAELMQQIVALPKPVIAAVEGVATAAGCSSSPPAISRSPAIARASPCPASPSASSVRRRWSRSAARFRASARWRWR